MVLHNEPTLHMYTIILLDKTNNTFDRQMGRTFCLTKTKLMGLGTGFMRSGDVIVVPFGCSTPILLRPEGRGNEFSYVGDVYIHGYMHGEAMKGKKPVKQYVLC